MSQVIEEIEIGLPDRLAGEEDFDLLEECEACMHEFLPEQLAPVLAEAGCTIFVCNKCLKKRGDL